MLLLCVSRILLSLSLFVGLIIPKPRKCHDLQEEFKDSSLKQTQLNEKDSDIGGEPTSEQVSVTYVL